MLRNSTIWESASRPLFVRSVWLETPNARRVAHQRHFILDYEPHQLMEQQLRRSFSSQGRPGRSGSLRPSLSSDTTNWEMSSELYASDENLLLIGSAKLKLHEPIAPPHVKLQQKLHKHYRRPTFAPRKEPPYGTNRRRFALLPDLISRHNSLQDLQSCLSNSCSNPDERLAERVLNWLDLAGKTDVVCSTESSKELLTDSMQRKLYKTPQRRYQAGNHKTGNVAQTRRALTAQLATNTSGNLSRRSVQSKSTLTQSAPAQRPEPVKHVTIIFNKDGVPVRLNRPARNIDLCEIASSPTTTRRLAGALASARLYQSADNNVNPVTGTTTKSASHMMHTGPFQFKEESHKSTQSKFSNDSADAKKQLHIFMPSLPKKGALAASLLGNTSNSGLDDSGSLISNAFSEFCKV